MTNEWLERIRKDKNMTHDQVATRAGISRHYYTMIANGNRRPSVKVAKRIANVLGFDWTRFFESEGDETLLNDHSA